MFVLNWVTINMIHKIYSIFFNLIIIVTNVERNIESHIILPFFSFFSFQILVKFTLVISFAMAGKNSKTVNHKEKKRKEKTNLQKIEPEKLLEPLIVYVFNLKKKKGGCRVKLNVFNLKKNRR